MKETQQDKILAMHADGFTTREMAESLGCSIGSVYSTLYKFGLKTNRYKCPNCGQIYNPNLIEKPMSSSHII